jgi:Fic family protein
MWPRTIDEIGEENVRTLTLSSIKLVQRIREEFEEAPELWLTVDQAARFWAIEADTCESVLSQLHESGFLLRTEDGHYRLR